MGESAFESIVGAEHCAPLAEERIDGTPVTAVVRPGGPVEVARCLDRARLRACPVLAAGAGTKLGWGNRFDAGELVRLDLRRLDGVLDLDPEEGIATAGAGVRVEQLERAAARHGKRTLLGGCYPEATVGGMIAADPVALVPPSRGRLRDEILGLQVAHPGGQLTRCGGKVVKNVTGFDLVRLYCGSLGTLGVITEATVRLRPLPERCACLRRELDGLQDALALARELAPLGPRRAALLPGDHRPSLVWELEGPPSEVAQRSDAVGGERVGPEALEAAAREIADPPAGAPGLARARVAARPGDTPSICDALGNLAGQRALRLVLPLAGIVLADLPEALAPRVIERGAREGWLVFLEQASPELKARVDVFGSLPDSLPLMRALKARFDPARVLSPGRFLGGI